MVNCANNLNVKPTIFADYNLHIEELKDHFSGKDHFQTNDVVEFYRSIETDLNRSTINWRVYKLVDRGILKRLGRGVFKLGESEQFTPVLAKPLKTLYKKVKNEFPYIEFCVWNTSFLNNLMLHQPFNFFTLIETEREVTESVFQYVNELKSNVFLSPNKEILQNYVQGSQDAIVVKPLISESPLEEIDGVITATLEKILVDLFCDTDLYATYQGVERRRIFQEAFSTYTINEKMMLRYADRRKRKEELVEYLNQLELLTLNQISND
ncbi:MAG: hypothetical protein JJU13_12590 [Balneolaceae bacterium]|nr:hypothetical protein [Balneolaceae bacterium]